MKSPFRYPGGKSKKAAREWILSHMPRDVDRYYEPMVGGGGIFFGLEDRKPFNCTLIDKHDGLISVYKALRDRSVPFIEQCRRLRPCNGDGDVEGVQRLRDEFERVKLGGPGIDEAYRYYIVNRMGWGGRVNYDIESRLYFSNPPGWNIVDTEVLREAADYLKTGATEVWCGDYGSVFWAVQNDPGRKWMYVDPPYIKDGQQPVTSQLYQHGFTRDDHMTLALKLRTIDPKDCMIAVSYHESWAVGMYDDCWHVASKELIYCGTAPKAGPKKIGREVLVMNYNPMKECV